MLATIIPEVFELKEAPEVAKALDGICAPDDNYGFSSAAIYCFWDPSTKEILYVGLARVIADRFRQHLGLSGCKPSSCKWEQIQKFFETHGRISYSIMVQSPLSQPPSRKRKQELSDIYKVDVSDFVQGEEAVAHAESMLIFLHEELKSKKPAWNKIGGAKYARKGLSLSPVARKLKFVQLSALGLSPQEIEKAMEERIASMRILDAFTGAQLSFLNAHSTIRELDSDPTFCTFEEYLHAPRILAADGLVAFETALRQHLAYNAVFKSRFEEMQRTSYLERNPFLKTDVPS